MQSPRTNKVTNKMLYFFLMNQWKQAVESSSGNKQWKQANGHTLTVTRAVTSETPLVSG